MQARGPGPRFHPGGGTGPNIAPDQDVFRFVSGGWHAVALTPCRSVPSTPTSTWSRSRSASWRAGASATSSPRPRGLRKGGEPWIFYEGPPTANGRPGLHHVWARVFKDLYPRFQTMRGRDVPRKGGWDCHGLPVELEVEKELGLHSKHEIEAYGIAAFNAALPRLGAALRRGLVVADQPRRHLDRHRRRLLDPQQRLHRVGLVAGEPAVGQGPALRGPPGHALLRPLRHRAVSPRGGPGLPRRRRPVDLRALPAHRGRGPRHAGADADLLVWTTTPWTLDLQRRRRRRPRHRLRARRRSRRRARPRDGEAAAARLFPDADGRSTAGRAPTWSGGATERPFDDARRSTTGRTQRGRGRRRT